MKNVLLRSFAPAPSDMPFPCITTGACSGMHHALATEPLGMFERQVWRGLLSASGDGFLGRLLPDARPGNCDSAGADPNGDLL